MSACLLTDGSRHFYQGLQQSTFTTRILTKKISRTVFITVYNFESDEICDLKWKTTSPNMEDDLTQNGRRPKMKKTKNEDDQQLRRPKIKTTTN